MKRTVLAVGLVLGLLATATIGHAASLTVSTAWLGSFSVSDRCTTATVPLTHPAITSSNPTATDVVLTIPAGCHGLAGVLHLNGVAGATDVAFTLPPSGAMLTIPIPSGYPAASVTGVALTLGTWGMPTSWTYTPPAAALFPVTCRIPATGATCAVTVTSITQWSDPGPGIDRFEILVDVLGNKALAGQRWELTFDFTNSQYPFIPRGLGSSGGLIVQGASCQPLVVRGTSAWGGVGNSYDTIHNTQARPVVLQGYLNAPGNLLNCF